METNLTNKQQQTNQLLYRMDRQTERRTDEQTLTEIEMLCCLKRSSCGNTLTFKMLNKKPILYVKHALVTLLVCNLQERANDKRILI